MIFAVAIFDETKIVFVFQSEAEWDRFIYHVRRYADAIYRIG